MKLYRRLFFVLGLFLVLQPAVAARFIVRHIQIQGNHRLSESAVLSYLPIHIGQTFGTEQSAAIVQSLYKSGYFSDIQLMRRGQTLIVHVQEFPVISQLSFSGNKAISVKKIKPILKQLSIQVGDIYRPQQFKKLREGLINAYHNFGYYDVAVDISIKKLTTDAIAIHVKVTQGIITKVHSIHFYGNHIFSTHALRGHFSLTTPGLFTFLSHRDRYSLYQLDNDIVSLNNFYYDHGYLDFRVISKKVSISPNRKRADISIHVYEGPQYHISGYRLTGKYTNDPKLRRLVRLHPGEVFSRVKIMTINSGITEYLSDRGYAFPHVRLEPQLNRTNRTVFLILHIDSGKRFYVRYVNTLGNQHTTGIVMRYQMRQFEGSSYSLSRIRESERRIMNLPYLRNIQVVPQPVPGTDNQVDLNYHVDEVNAGRASIQGGYSDVDGFLYGANVTEPNFMGTGKAVSIGFQRSSYVSQYSVSYSNPFYTLYGMSRSISVYYNHTTPTRVNLDAYTMDTYGGSVNYTLPISEYNYFLFGYGYSHVIILNPNPMMISPEGFEFLQKHPSPYNNFTGSGGLVHSDLDRAIFPNSGNVQRLGVNFAAPILHSSLSFYKVDYTGRWYFPLGRSGFIIHPHTILGYGNGYGDVGSLPFFLNYYGGGIDTLPGYEPNTLGPLNPNDRGNAIGGNIEVFGGVNLIFPNGLGEKVRTSLFTSFGNIFQTNRVVGNPGNPLAGSINYESIRFNNLRWSSGVLVSWESPFGILSASYGIPYNVKGSRVQQFGFKFGASL